jgi:hypothetical protein
VQGRECPGNYRIAGSSGPTRIAGFGAVCVDAHQLQQEKVQDPPLNNRLPQGAIHDWSQFLRGWVPANHVRAALSIAGAAGLLIPLNP